MMVYPNHEYGAAVKSRGDACVSNNAESLMAINVKSGISTKTYAGWGYFNGLVKQNHVCIHLPTLATYAEYWLQPAGSQLLPSLLACPLSLWLLLPSSGEWAGLVTGVNVAEVPFWDPHARQCPLLSSWKTSPRPPCEEASSSLLEGVGPREQQMSHPSWGLLAEWQPGTYHQTGGRRATWGMKTSRSTAGLNLACYSRAVKKRNGCCFRSVCFEVVCYKAIDNWYVLTAFLWKYEWGGDKEGLGTFTFYVTRFCLV